MSSLPPSPELSQIPQPHKLLETQQSKNRYIISTGQVTETLLNICKSIEVIYKEKKLNPIFMFVVPEFNVNNQFLISKHNTKDYKELFPEKCISVNVAAFAGTKNFLLNKLFKIYDGKDKNIHEMIDINDYGFNKCIELMNTLDYFDNYSKTDALQNLEKNIKPKFKEFHTNNLESIKSIKNLLNEEILQSNKELLTTKSILEIEEKSLDFIELKKMSDLINFFKNIKKYLSNTTYSTSEYNTIIDKILQNDNIIYIKNFLILKDYFKTNNNYTIKQIIKTNFINFYKSLIYIYYKIINNIINISSDTDFKSKFKEYLILKKYTTNSDLKTFIDYINNKTLELFNIYTSMNIENSNDLIEEYLYVNKFIESFNNPIINDIISDNSNGSPIRNLIKIIATIGLKLTPADIACMVVMLSDTDFNIEQNIKLKIKDGEKKATPDNLYNFSISIEISLKNKKLTFNNPKHIDILIMDCENDDIVARKLLKNYNLKLNRGLFTIYQLNPSKIQLDKDKDIYKYINNIDNPDTQNLDTKELDIPYLKKKLNSDKSIEVNDGIIMVDKESNNSKKYSY